MNYHNFGVYNTNAGVCRTGGPGVEGHEYGIFCYVVGTSKTGGIVKRMGFLALNYNYFYPPEHDVFVLSFDHNINAPSGCGIYGVCYRDVDWPTAGSHVLSLSLSFYQIYSIW